METRGPRRRNMMGETRLLMEWAREKYPGRAWHTSYRVGTTPEVAGFTAMEPEEIALARNLNRRVDLLIEPPPDVIIVEACMWRSQTKVAQLEEYLLLLPASPGFAAWKGYPVRPILLTAQDDPVARLLCRRRGFEYELYTPSWMSDWYAAYPDRKKRAPHAGMVDHLSGGLLPPSSL